MVPAPAVITPLVEAAKSGEDLTKAVTTIVRSLGFDICMYGMSSVFRPGDDNLVYIFTTAPREWTRLYQQAAYIEVDPRVDAAIDSTLPYVWDQSTERGKSVRVDEFLDDAARYGICSGVSFVVPDSNGASVVLWLSSPEPVLNQQQRTRLINNFGAMFTFGYYFHELFMRRVLDEGLPSALEGTPLTARERECLSMAANGLTTEDIAQRLGIRPRTAQFHFDQIRTKLAVATRHEAIARAVHQGLIRITTP